MKSNTIVRIVTDIEEFQDRIDELGSDVSFEDVKHCASQLKRVLYQNDDCAAVCAPQIGNKLRMFVVKTAKDEADRFKVFLNPMIVTSEGLHMSREANISFPGKQYIIPRKNQVQLAYQTIDGHVESEAYIGAYAEVIQQMVEMLDGITLADYGLDLDDVGGIEAFDKASKKAKAEVLAMYIDSIKQLSGELAEEIENTPELKYINDVITFNTGVLKGDIILTKSDNQQQEGAADGI